MPPMKYCTLCHRIHPATTSCNDAIMEELRESDRPKVNTESITVTTRPRVAKVKPVPLPKPVDLSIAGMDPPIVMEHCTAHVLAGINDLKDDAVQKGRTQPACLAFVVMGNEDELVTLQNSMYAYLTELTSRLKHGGHLLQVDNIDRKAINQRKADALELEAQKLRRTPSLRG